MTFSTDLIFDVLRKYEPDHLLLEAAWADARERLTDVARLGDLLDRAAGTMLHQKLERISPLAIPVLVLIGRESVAASDLDDEGHLLEPLVWAALDCATGWPAIAQAGRPMVLGRMVAEVLAPVPPADLVVVGSAAGHDGRKHLGTSALYDADGQLLARAEGLWIELR